MPAASAWPRRRCMCRSASSSGAPPGGEAGVLINPVLAPIGEEMENGWEGCLSIPGLRGCVPRWRRLRYAGLDTEGAAIAGEAEGLLARVMQHEADHLDGVLYPMRMEDLSLFGFTEELARGRGRSRRVPPGDHLVTAPLAERSPVRDAAIRAMLPIAAGQGWSWATIRAGLKAAGEDPALAASHFPGGPVDAILGWIDLANREMEAAAAAEDILALRVPTRIRRVVELRLQAVAPHKEALRRALAQLALPWNAAAGLRASASTVSAMWYAAGDTSADVSWYTRRATLGGIYWATLAWWMRDDDPDLTETMAFLDRRLAGHARFQKTLKRVRPAAA